jgi:CrcB protein
MRTENALRAVETLLLVAAGGALGANLRYVVALALPGLSGTFAANVTGCLVLGFVLYEREYTDVLAERTRVVFGTGFLSSYTTYSTFALETVEAAGTLPVWALVNVVGNYAVGFLAVLLGRALALRFRDATEVGS